jgi:hypothetical protein
MVWGIASDHEGKSVLDAREGRLTHYCSEGRGQPSAIGCAIWPLECRYPTSPDGIGSAGRTGEAIAEITDVMDGCMA